MTRTATDAAARCNTSITWVDNGKVRTERARFCRHNEPWACDFYLTATGRKVTAHDVVIVG